MSGPSAIPDMTVEQAMERCRALAEQFPPQNLHAIGAHFPCHEFNFIYAIAKKYYTENNLPMPNIYRIRHTARVGKLVGIDVEQWRGKPVAFFDVCPTVAEQGLLSEVTNNQYFIADHHSYAPNKDFPGIFTQIICGSLMAWFYFFPDAPVPAVLKCVDAQDRGKWDMVPGSKNFYALYNLISQSNPMLAEILLGHDDEEKILNLLTEAGALLLPLLKTWAEPETRKSIQMVETPRGSFMFLSTPAFIFLSTLVMDIINEKNRELQAAGKNLLFTVVTYPSENPDEPAVAIRSVTGNWAAGHVAKSIACGGGGPNAAGIQNFEKLFEGFDCAALPPNEMTIQNHAYARFRPEIEDALIRNVTSYIKNEVSDPPIAAEAAPRR